jgi:hypothetical protein
MNSNGEEWRVLLASPFHPQLRRGDGSWSMGVCDDIMKTIYIREDLDLRLMKKVLCHEITHAAMFSYNIEMNLAQEELFADLVATYGQEIVCKTNSFFNRLKENRESC